MSHSAVRGHVIVGSKATASPFQTLLHLHGRRSRQLWKQRGGRVIQRANMKYELSNEQAREN